MVEEVALLALELTGMRCFVVLVALVTPATIVDSVPAFAVPTDRLLALTGGPVEDGVSWVAVAGVVVRVVSLIFVTHSGTGLVSEVVDLPFHAVAIDRLALLQVGVPSVIWLAGRHLALSGVFVEVRFVLEALAGVILFIVSVVHLAASNTFLCQEVVELPFTARFYRFDRRTFGFEFVVLVAGGTGRLNAHVVFVVEERVFGGTLAAVSVRVVLLVYLAFDVALLGHRVVCLPDLAGAVLRGTFSQLSVPEMMSRTLRNSAFSGVWIEMRGVGKALTSAVSTIVSVVDFAHIQTFFKSKVIFLPLIAFFVNGRALYEMSVPHMTFRAFRLNASPGLGIEMRHLWLASAAVGVRKIGVVVLTLCYAFLSGEVVLFPRVATAELR